MICIGHFSKAGVGFFYKAGKVLAKTEFKINVNR